MHISWIYNSLFNIFYHYPRGLQFNKLRKVYFVNHLYEWKSKLINCVSIIFSQVKNKINKWNKTTFQFCWWIITGSFLAKKCSFLWRVGRLFSSMTTQPRPFYRQKKCPDICDENHINMLSAYFLKNSFLTITIINNNSNNNNSSDNNNRNTATFVK